MSTDLAPGLRAERVNQSGANESLRVWNGDALVAATCAECRVLVEAGDLVGDRSRKGGKKMLCNPCNRSKGRRHYAANSDAVREKVRTYYAETTDEQRARAREYFAANTEDRRKYHASYRVENAELLRAKQAARNAASPEVGQAWRRSAQGRASKAASNHSRRARMREGNCGCVSARSLLNLWETAGGACAYCNAPAEHYDHIVPLARGGRHCLVNLALACAGCNLRKGQKSLAEFTEGEVADLGIDRCIYTTVDSSYRNNP